MHLLESGEMYLESILQLTQKQGHVRSVDISEYMGYSKPSVSRAVGLLKQGGYLTVERDGSLVLTQEGIAAAQRVFERHTILAGMFRSLGVSPETASEDACRVEHILSDETFEAIKRHMEKFRDTHI